MSENTSNNDGGYPSAAKIAIVGAGAIGGLLGVHLSLQGHTVTFIARGSHLEAMQARGSLQLVSPDGSTIESAPFSANGGSKFVRSVRDCACEQDVIILGLKTHQLVDVADDLAAITGPRTVILTTQNGIPWWYFQHFPPPTSTPSQQGEGDEQKQGPDHEQYLQLRDRTVESVDPGGHLKQAIDADKILALVVYPAAAVTSPGVIHHQYGVRFPIGEINRAQVDSVRVHWMSSILTAAGFKSPVLPDVRAELWLKLWGTVAVNPLSALTHATLDVLCSRDSPGRRVAKRVMTEAETVANRLGATMRVPLVKRLDGARDVGKHRTSMLQDVMNGRDLEVKPVVEAVVELAEFVGVDVPATKTVLDTVLVLQDVMKQERAKVCLVPLDQSHG